MLSQRAIHGRPTPLSIIVPILTALPMQLRGRTTGNHLNAIILPRLMFLIQHMWNQPFKEQHMWPYIPLLATIELLIQGATNHMTSNRSFISSLISSPIQSI